MAQVETGESLTEALPVSDVLYVTRVQKERFSSAAEYEAVAGSYVVDAAALTSAKPDMRILHPLPRVNEIATDVDADPRATYFEQVRLSHMRTGEGEGAGQRAGENVPLGRSRARGEARDNNGGTC